MLRVASAQALAAWRATASREARNRGVARACLAQIQCRTLTAALQAWQSAAARQRRLHATLTGCLSRLHHRMLLWAWDAWRTRLQQKQLLSARLAHGLAGRRDRTLRSCFLFWRWHAWRAVQLRARLREAAARRKVQAVGDVLRAWAQRAKRGTAVKARLRLVLYRMLEARLARALRGWRVMAALQRRQRTVLAVATTRLRHTVSPALLYVPPAVGASCSLCALLYSPRPHRICIGLLSGPLRMCFCMKFLTGQRHEGHLARKGVRGCSRWQMQVETLCCRPCRQHGVHGVASGGTQLQSMPCARVRWRTGWLPD